MAAHNYILGFDIGSSSVKTSLVDVESGAVAGKVRGRNHLAENGMGGAGPTDMVGKLKTGAGSSHARLGSEGK